ncbi:NAD(P)H-dependent glycerol-3-phosphate dehydrogenase [Sulfitobacter sp. S190]|uniref:NAD(P)H-dependent glycerol-3-phosphate dehydrogenase n=1 Tax=Sulfitobacter sp. S190 TaxID=2867022 RepID=UPI0021A2C7B1|nr:NAD(P)H-dependent glycerol-3-phosphate dehydrogenase [Sulfitobacter sp. S190]UWR22437.1 NAD(P)-dependent glycerol-3-phosphate dehydrogenase [Sulfitobacter sp. S190]
MSVAVMGAGAFGTALAIALGQKMPVTLWARDVGDMARLRENRKRLPGCAFSQGVSVTDDRAKAWAADVILLAVPMQQLRGFLQASAPAFKNKKLVACCKGIEIASGVGPVGVITQEAPDATAAILTGPSFAADIARGLPTALTFACTRTEAAKPLQHLLTTPTLRLYRTHDTLGAELGGALKNVIAIACGAAMGAGLGESARAALMTRGYAEMQRLAAHLGAEPDTLSGLSGFGDLALTCTSTGSRNYRLGAALGAGETFDQNTTVEGAATARAVHALAVDAALDLPITAAVAAVVEGRLDVATAMRQLLDRPLKEE